MFTPLRTAAAMYALCERLFPICRSITGAGVRDTLTILQEHLDLTVHEVPTGTPAFDWQVPREGNIRSAWIADSSGRRLVDLANSNLHVMSYSTPVDKVVDLQELQQHLYSLPDFPDRIPYRTSYYDERWGFCLSHRQREALVDGQYRVHIDSTLIEGSLTYGEYFIPGERDEELLVSTHVCHPSLANDNLSGMAVAIALAQSIAALPHMPRYGVRFIFIPGTIGAITWLAVNTARIAAIASGVVLSGVGDPGCLTFKQSKRGDGPLDRAFG